MQTLCCAITKLGQIMAMMIDRFALGLSPYGPDAVRPYRQALCAPQSDISLGEPCPFTKVSDGSQT